MRLPTRKSERARHLLTQDDHYYTRAAIARMTREKARLLAERPEAAEEVARTAAMGDLSENAAYTAAKFYLRRINDRITSIGEKLKFAIIIEEGSSDGVVRIGSTVTVCVNGKDATFAVLGAHETNPSKGAISYLSPVGAALLGHRAGDVVVVRGISYSIVRVA